MNKPRILVISSANIDFVQRMRRVPYSGETVVETDLDYTYVPGGKGGNAAVAFARFGADTVFACKLGKDTNGKKLSAIYKYEGIDTNYVLMDEEYPTGLASILIEENGKNRIIVYPGANNAFRPDEVEETLNSLPDAIFMQFELPDETIIEVSRQASRAGIPLFIDAGPARLDFPLGKLGKVEIFSPNEVETRVYTGITPSSEESCLRAAIRLSSMVDAKYIVLKLGERGAFIYDGREYFTVPAEDVVAVDTTAAGDIFSAVMTYVYLINGNIVSAVKYATCAAALSIQKEGAYPSIPTRDEVMAYVRAKLAAEAASNAETEDEDYY